MGGELLENLIPAGSGGALLNGLAVTLKISLLSLFFGAGLGAAVCAARISRFRVLRIPAQIYISVLRGTPVLMLLLLMYYVVLAGTPLSASAVAVAAFSLNAAAHFAELMRSSLEAVDPAQTEAARTLGFGRLDAFLLVTLPQAAAIAAPVAQSLIVNLIQWTSVVGYVSITDLARTVNNIGARTMRPLGMIVVGMVIYLGISYLVYGFFDLARRLGRKRRERSLRT